jgi:type IV pilus assembly protein PilP
MNGMGIRHARRREGGSELSWTMVVLGTMLCLAPGLSQAQVNAIRPPDSLKVPAVQDISRQQPSAEVPGLAPPDQPSKPEPAVATSSGLTYDPSGRRDPFVPMIGNNQEGQPDAMLPPLQRIGLTELSLIGIVWGSHGYTAMVQTPDGKGYSIRRGTRVGPNNGVVSSITDRGFIVQERFTDVYGNKQEREYVKLLHAKEGLE